MNTEKKEKLKIFKAGDSFFKEKNLRVKYHFQNGMILPEEGNPIPIEGCNIVQVIVQCGKNQFFRDANIFDSYKVENGKVLVDDRWISIKDCLILDLSIYKWKDKYFRKGALTGKFMPVKYNSKKETISWKGKAPFFLQDSHIIDLEENPLKSNNRRIWRIGILALIILVLISFFYSLFINNKWSIESPKREMKLELVPRAFFFPRFHIPKRFGNDVYIIYNQDENMSWGYLKGKRIPDRYFKITKQKGKILFEWKKEKNNVSFFVYYPDNYDSDNNYMFHFH